MSGDADGKTDEAHQQQQTAGGQKDDTQQLS